MNEQKTPNSRVTDIWMVTREYHGLAGAGGVKDVCRQLSEALVKEGGCDTRVVMPCYGFMDPVAFGFVPVIDPSSSKEEPLVFSVNMNYVGEERKEEIRVHIKKLNGVIVYLIDSDRFREKHGVYTYTLEEQQAKAQFKKGTGHYDYFAMNILLQKAALGLMVILNERPQVIHCHDGHTAVLPAMVREEEGYRHYFRDTGVVATIHNAGVGYHQEVEDLRFARAITGLPERIINGSLLGRTFDPFLSAAPYALLTTVSERYSLELQESEEDVRTGWLGHTLLDRSVRINGITNGITPGDFDPSRPKKVGLKFGFDPSNGKLIGKQENKKELLRLLSSKSDLGPVERYGSLSRDVARPLFTFIGRLTSQKGVDVLLLSLKELMEEDPDFAFVMLGSGAAEYEEQFRMVAEDERFAGRCCILKGYSPELATQIYAAGDFFLIPSLYEPCGLTDYIAQLYGNLPIAHYVGGLVKVIDGKTGFTYQEHRPADLSKVIRRALETYRSSPEDIKTMQRQAVERIHKYHTWEKVMGQYLDIYKRSITMDQVTKV
ncbi:MAG: glycogen/starch synthase [Desulfobulbaceae bacterium]|nr:glycogen/starch synthase [Desulfobulbaceae bacterium]